MNRIGVHLHVAAAGILLALCASSPAIAWEGEGCAAAADLRAIVDEAYAAVPDGDPFGDGRGSGAAGFSVAMLHDDCGLFTHAVGLRHVERRRPMRVATRQHVGSLTKPVTTALTLILNDQGLFGEDGLDTPVASLLSAQLIKQLRKGRVPGEPLCPARIQAVDRVTQTAGSFRAPCPNFRKFTVRQLLNGNHGMWDFINEIDRDGNGQADYLDLVLAELLDALGVGRFMPAGEIKSGFDLLTATGVLKNKQARIGGTRERDYETSYGNTGFQILGILLETLSGQSFDELAKRHIVRPLGLGKMGLQTERPRRLGRTIASEYLLTTGAAETGDGSLGEDLLGVYPLADVNGHPAYNFLNVEPFLFTNGGGGAGAVVTSPRSYVRFFHRLVLGGLLSAAAQQELDGAFLPIQGTTVSHGFGIFRETSANLGTLIDKGGSTLASNCVAIHSLADSGGNGATAVVCRNSGDLFLPNEAAGLPNSAVSVSSVAVDLLEAARPADG